MSRSLVLVESPAKAKTIEKYLGKDYKVLATYGHIKDLPVKYLGVKVEKEFEPIYELTPRAKKIVSEIKKTAKEAENIYIASDPDREGEAIAFHIKEELEDLKKEIKRVLFFEITKNAIIKAFENPTSLDEKKYDAQKSRRVLDRLVGYKISPLLWYKVKSGLSAGRVQSVALLLICRREKEIKNFIPEEYWYIKGDFFSPDKEKKVRAKLEEIDGKKIELKNKESVDEILVSLKNREFFLKSVVEKERVKNPSEPFITSTLQQDAVKRLRFSTKKTMMIAQMLYEGIDLGDLGRQGLITYMRTDSPRISKEAIDSARDFIAKKYGKDYLSHKPRQFEGKKQAQEAHECIRPTNPELEPDLIKEYLTNEQYQLYKLIFNRFLASQMKPALYSQRIYEIVDREENRFTFRAKGLALKYAGFLMVYGKDEDDEEEEKEGGLPMLEEKTVLTLLELIPEQNFTSPPPRFTEATLVKELEEDGIGRPSTYATIISTLLEKDYVKLMEGKFYPTELGCTVVELLEKNFPDIIDVEFTAKMEEKLDLIEEGRERWTEVMKEFYAKFNETLNKAKVSMENLKRKGIETDIVCDICGRKMVIKMKGRNEFLACSGYPECKNIRNFTKDKSGQIVVLNNKTDKKCPKCGAEMVVKRGPYSNFLACSNYPNCKYTENITTGIKCPKCDGQLVERKTKKGRVFYGCNRYPQCDYLINQKPVNEKCPLCNNPFLIEKREKKQPALVCPNKDCGFKKSK
ncbi:MAG: type I DNA topoisomerase [Proteobacteria bacterium]|nr:type I DNA topoisomerase [Pseudomonadota bacterium]